MKYANVSSKQTLYDDVIKWKHFPRYWLFVRESTAQQLIPITNASDAGFDVFFDLRLNKRLSKQSKRRWFETPSRSLWRHYKWHGETEHEHTNTLKPLLRPVSVLFHSRLLKARSCWWDMLLRVRRHHCLAKIIVISYSRSWYSAVTENSDQ